MTYLNLAPAITAIRSRPEEFEFSDGTLHHLSSRHRFRFLGEDDVRIEAACNCAFLRATPEQSRAFYTAYSEWHASYWRPFEINREFASHFEPPALWRRVAVWLLRRLVSWQPSRKPHAVQAGLPLQPVG